MKKKRKTKEDVYLLKKKLCEKYPQKYNMDMCLARKKQNNGKTKRCTRKAIEGTGRCKLHGGMSTGPIIHGKYSKYFKGKLSQMYEFFRRDPRVLDVKDEIALMRTLVVECRKLLNDANDDKSAFFLRGQLTNILDTVVKNIERVHKIRGSVVSIEVLPILIRQMVEILAEVVSTCPHCHKDISKLQGTMYDRMVALRLPSDNWPGQAHNKNIPRVIDAEFKKID